MALTLEVIGAIIAGVLGSGGIGAAITAVISSRNQSRQLASADWQAFTAEVRSALADCHGANERLQTEVNSLNTEIARLNGEITGLRAIIDRRGFGGGLTTP